jgi:hypothetical protein
VTCAGVIDRGHDVARGLAEEREHERERGARRGHRSRVGAPRDRAGRPVDGDALAFAQRASIGEADLVWTYGERGPARDARLAQPTGDDRRLAGQPSVHRDDAGARAHRVQIFWLDIVHEEDRREACGRELERGARGQTNAPLGDARAGGGADHGRVVRRGVDAELHGGEHVLVANEPEGPLDGEPAANEVVNETEGDEPRAPESVHRDQPRARLVELDRRPRGAAYLELEPCGQVDEPRSRLGPQAVELRRRSQREPSVERGERARAQSQPTRAEPGPWVAGDQAREPARRHQALNQQRRARRSRRQLGADDREALARGRPELEARCAREPAEGLIGARGRAGANGRGQVAREARSGEPEQGASARDRGLQLGGRGRCRLEQRQAAGAARGGRRRPDERPGRRAEALARELEVEAASGRDAEGRDRGERAEQLELVDLGRVGELPGAGAMGPR